MDRFQSGYRLVTGGYIFVIGKPYYSTPALCLNFLVWGDHHASAIPVTPPDTTGAGGYFNAGFIKA